MDVIASDYKERGNPEKNNIADGFSKKYNCKMLVFYEIHETTDSAINREKQIKLGSREKTQFN
ncbi:MAG: hypothetical protein RCO49_06790 [Rickettsia endosymbiont of Argas persicus]